MTEFIYFLGRFHVLALHLPIGIIFAAVGLEWLTRGGRNQSLKNIMPYLWGLSAITAIITVVLGYMHISEGNFDGASANAHRLYGTTLAVITTLVWFFCCKFPSVYSRFKLLFSLILITLVTLTGHYGGNLTHGSTYLVEYAPNPIRTMAGLNARRPPVNSLAVADPYYDVISPMLRQRCSACHNKDKSRGQLNITNYGSILVGGKSGSAIVPNNIGESELYHRVTLASDHEDYMPADGKIPLTKNQVKLVRWWINSGAPSNVTFADDALASTVTPELETLLMNELGLGAFQTGASTDTEKAEIDQQVVDSLYLAGFRARQLSKTDSKIIVNSISPSKMVNAQQIDTLIQSANHIVQLDLQGAGLDDQQVKQFGSFIQLKRLRLNNNNLTDEGIHHILSLPQLEYLNLYGNQGITDKSIDAIAAATTIKKLFLWRTTVTAKGIEQLKVLRPDLKIEVGTSDQTK